MQKKVIIGFAFLISCLLIWGAMALCRHCSNAGIEFRDIELVYSIVRQDKARGMVSVALADDSISTVYRKVWQSPDGAVHIELSKQGGESALVRKDKIPGLLYGVGKGNETTYSRVEGFSFTFELDASKPCEELYIGDEKMRAVNLLWNSPAFKDEFIMCDVEGLDD